MFKVINFKSKSFIFFWVLREMKKRKKKNLENEGLGILSYFFFFIIVKICNDHK